MTLNSSSRASAAKRSARTAARLWRVGLYILLNRIDDFAKVRELVPEKAAVR
jgi:hypothetical protein